MQNIRDLLTELTDINMNKVSDQIVVTMTIIVGLLVVASFFALFVSIYLAIAYAKYNRTKNTCGKTGEEAARLVLDNNELEHIKVSKKRLHSVWKQLQPLFQESTSQKTYLEKGQHNFSFNSCAEGFPCHS